MGKNDAKWIAGAIIIAVYLLGQQGGEAPSTTTNGGSIDLCKLVDGSASFTGQTMYLTGTALTDDWVRVIRQGSILDLGYVSLDSGTLSTAPGGSYKLYYGENNSATARYTAVESYSAPCQDAIDDKVGVLCTIDTDPTVTVFDENGQVQSSNTGVQALTNNDIIDVEVKIKASSDECYGNPDAPTANVICFEYSSNAYDSVKVTGATALTGPSSISDLKATGNSSSCYEFDKIADAGSDRFTVKIDVKDYDPSTQNNITIRLEDVAFDLDQDTLAEIWGFEDESGNDLGSAVVTGDVIAIS